MYKVKIRHLDGEEINCPDISYDKFLEFMWSKGIENIHGTSDIDYYDYLRRNNMMKVTDLNFQTTPEIELIIEEDWSGRVLKFKCIYDSDNEEEE